MAQAKQCVLAAVWEGQGMGWTDDISAPFLP